MSAIIDSYYYSPTINQIALYSGSNIAISQSFTANLAYPVNSCQFLLARIGSPPGNVYAKLYEHSGTFGTSSVPGSLLATSNPVAASSLPTYGAFVTFTFPTPYTLTQGTKYCIVIEYSDGNGSNYVAVGTDVSQVTHPGNYAVYVSSWTPSSSRDTDFYVSTNSSPVAIRAVGTPAYVGTGGVTPAIPAGVQVGDLLIAIAYSRVDSITFTCSAGWDERYDPGGQLYGSWAVYTRVYQAGDGNPTITPSTNESIIAVIFALYNCDTSTIFDVAIQGSGFAAPGSPYDIAISSFSTYTNDALAFYCWGSQDDNTWVYQSGGGTQQVSQDNIAGTDNSICIATESLATAGGTGDQVARQTNKAGDAGRKLWFAIKPAAAGNSYSESITLASAGGISDSRITGINPTASLPVVAAISESSVWNGFIALALAAAAGVSGSGTWDGFGAIALSGNAALTPAGGLELERSATLPGAAAIAEAADIALLKELGLTCQAGIALGSVLAAGSSVSLASGTGFGLGSLLAASPAMFLASSAGLAEARITDLLGSASLPGAAATVEQALLAALNALGLSAGAGISEARLLAIFKAISLPGSAVTVAQALIAALNALGLSVSTGISEAALLEALNGTNLSGSGALELLSTLIAQGALVLSGNAGLGTDGVVEGQLGQDYYENIELSSLAAVVKSALMEMLASSDLPGAAHISVAGLMQATSAALLSASGALTPGHILDRLAAAQFSAAAGVSLGTFLQALNGVLLSASGSISPAAVNAALNLLALAATASLDELVQIAFTKTLGLAGAAAQQVAMALERSGSISLPAAGGLAAAAELGMMQTVSLTGIASITTARQMDCAGFLLLESVGAFVTYFGPRVKRGYRLELILDELELDLKLK